MKNIVEVDKNLAVETNIVREGLCLFDSEKFPFKIYGVFKENGIFRRMPETVAQNVSTGVNALHTHSAGGRVRFVTDSPYVAIKTKYEPWKMPHFALAGSAGFDMYSEYNDETRYEGTFVPPFDVVNEYESVKDFSEQKERVITINFPLYSSVTNLYIGLKEGSVLREAPKYKIEKPVVYYGSSITQGGCASKPGSSYQSILSRRFDCDYINLGFSGSAKGEDEIINYIKQLDMSAFVMDYDYNAPSVEHLQKTHRKMFENIRKAQPDLPIVILSRPRYYLKGDEKERLDVIYDTYLTATKRDDKNVYFISGQKLMEIVKDNGTVDGSHPSDSGFYSMACAISEVFETIFKKL